MHKSYGILKIQDVIQYSLLTGAKKLPTVLKKQLIVPVANIHNHKTRQRNPVYEVKPRRHIANRQLKCMASKEFNSLPKDVTQKLTHGEFKNEFYDFKLRSYKESTLNFASNML